MLTSMVIWGMSWSSAKVLSEYGSALSLVYFRFVIVAITLGILLPILKINLTPNKKSLPYIAGTALFMGLYSLTFFSGVSRGFAGAGGVLVTTINPIFAYLIGMALHKQIPTKREFTGLLAGIIGGLILIQVWDKSDQLLQSGNLFFITAAFLWAAMSKTNSIGARYVNPFNFIFWVNIFAVIGFSFIVDFNELTQMMQIKDSLFWSNTIYMGTINSAGATVVFLYATTKIGAEKASSFNFLVPMCALLGSWLFLSEKITLITLTGGSIAISAVILLNSKKKFKKLP